MKKNLTGPIQNTNRNINRAKMAECCNKYVNNLPCTLRDALRYVLNAGHKSEMDMLSTIFIFFSTCILLLQQYC